MDEEIIEEEDQEWRHEVSFIIQPGKQSYESGINIFSEYADTQLLVKIYKPHVELMDEKDIIPAVRRVAADPHFTDSAKVTEINRLLSLLGKAR